MTAQSIEIVGRDDSLASDGVRIAALAARVAKIELLLEIFARELELAADEEQREGSK